ncbi:MAG: hypothetical protein JO307_28405 [Bryobacterales bacterium]|nr:hypothetical protein [Bryobacterales bacterium]MBV9399047.1 hypothetical protein [Bryobacterales bacterium]
MLRIGIIGWLSAGALLLPGLGRAQEGPRGHWAGSIDIPGQSLAFEVDLDKTAKGWIGSASIPLMNATGIPLDSIAQTDGKWIFEIKVGGANPTFAATLAADGESMAGTLTQRGMVAPFTLKRTGDPKVELPKNSPPVTKEFIGTWEGTLDAGQRLRMILKISNSETGSSGVFTSVDQGGAQIPVSGIEQKGTMLTLRVNAVGGDFTGEINKEGTEINGTWTQVGMSFPLVLKKSGDQ